MHIGKVIAELRTTNELLQKDLASELNITPAYLSAIENGHFRPGLVLLYRISDYFNKPVAVLIYQALGVKTNNRHKTANQLKQMNLAAEPILRYLVSHKKKFIKQNQYSRHR